MKKFLLILLSLLILQNFLSFSVGNIIPTAEANYTLRDLGDSLYPKNVSDLFTKDRNEYKSEDVALIIATLTKYLLKLAGTIAVFFIIWSGFSYVSSLGQQEKLETAKKGLLWSVLGLLAVMFSYAIVENIINMFIGVPPS